MARFVIFPLLALTAPPAVDGSAGTAGTSRNVARGDHRHGIDPLVSTLYPSTNFGADLGTSTLQFASLWVSNLYGGVDRIRFDDLTVPAEVAGQLNRYGNALSYHVGTEAVYLAMFASVFRKTYDPPFQTYNPGITVVATYNVSTARNAIIPLRWRIPPAIYEAGTGILLLRPGVRFTFDDGSTISREGDNITETYDGIDMAADGRYIVRVEFYVNGVTVNAQPGDIGTFTVNGFEI